MQGERLRLMLLRLRKLLGDRDGEGEKAVEDETLEKGEEAAETETPEEVETAEIARTMESDETPEEAETD